MTTVVLLVNSITELGGAARVAHTLAGAFASRDHDVVLVGLETAEEPRDLDPQARYSRITLLDRPVPSAAQEQERQDADARITAGLADVLRGRTPGVIITTQVWCKEMLDQVAHDGWRVIGQYHSSFEAAERSGDLERLVASYATTPLLVLTEDDAAAFRRGGIARTSALANPLVFWPESPATDGERVITYLGRLSEEKAPELLADAWQALEGRHPQWRLRFVGSGPLVPRIVERALPRCEVLPPTDDPATMLLSTGILALPSLVEGFPLSLMEAMACGVPAVAADASAGVRELLDDGRTGLLVVRGDSGDLADALERLMVDDAMRRRLGEQARMAAAAYRPDVILDRWKELLAAG